MHTSAKRQYRPVNKTVGAEDSQVNRPAPPHTETKGLEHMMANAATKFRAISLAVAMDQSRTDVDNTCARARAVARAFNGCLKRQASQPPWGARFRTSRSNLTCLRLWHRLAKKSDARKSNGAAQKESCDRPRHKFRSFHHPGLFVERMEHCGPSDSDANEGRDEPVQVPTCW